MNEPEEPEEPKCGIAGLLVAGGLAVVVALVMMFAPVPYVSFGGAGHHGAMPVMSVFGKGDSFYLGLLILFLGAFILALAYRIRRP